MLGEVDYVRRGWYVLRSTRFYVEDRVFWALMSSSTIIGSRRFERTYRLEKCKKKKGASPIGVPIFPVLTDSTYIFNHVLEENEKNTDVTLQRDAVKSAITVGADQRLYV